MQVGSARSERGKVTRGHLTLGSYPDGPIQSPVVIATGTREGPTLWVQGCIHGPEVVGPLCIVRDLVRLSSTTL